MTSKFYEKKVKELATKKSNKECIDCGKKGVQNNVNLTHWTFICTRCSGLHRSLGHVSKSIGMHNFTKEQYEGLENGGNKRAKKHWFAQLPEDFKYPEHELKLQEFLRSVYVDKVYYRKEEAPKSNTQKKSKPKPKAAAVPKKHEGEPRSPLSTGSSAPLPPLASQKTGDSQISHLSQRSNGSVGSEDSDGGDDRGIDLLGDSFNLTEVETKAPTSDKGGQKSGAVDLFGDSFSPGPAPIPSLESSTGPSSRRNSRIAPVVGGRQAAIEAFVIQLSDVKDQFKLSESDFKAYVAEAVKIVLTSPPPATSTSDEGNPFDDDDDTPVSAAVKPSYSAASAPKPATSASASLFPDMDGPLSSPPPSLGPAVTRPVPAYTTGGFAPAPAYSTTPSYTPTPIPTYGTHPMPGSSPAPGYYMAPGGQVVHGPPTGPYMMTNGVGPTHGYGVPGVGGVLMVPAAGPAVPEKPKVDLFAGLDPFAK